MRAHEITENAQTPEQILQDQDAMEAVYLCINRGRRWPAAEEFIANNCKATVTYNRDVVNGWDVYNKKMQFINENFAAVWSGEVPNLAGIIDRKLSKRSDLSEIYTSPEWHKRFYDLIIKSLNEISNEGDWSWVVEALAINEISTHQYIHDSDYLDDGIGEWWSNCAAATFITDNISTAAEDDPGGNDGLEIMYDCGSDVHTIVITALSPILDVIYNVFDEVA